METELTPWHFVEKYYPNYSTCSQIAYADDLQKIIDGEIDEGSHAEKIWSMANEDIKAIREDYDTVHKEIYEKAIEAFIELHPNLVKQ